MRRLLAILMALIMLMSSFPVLAEENVTGGKLTDETYTQPLSKVRKLVEGYAVLLRDAKICSDRQLKKAIGSAEEGDVVYAVGRRGYGTSGDSVKVTWACDGESLTGWIAAKHLRLMDKDETKAYEKKAQKNKKAVRHQGKFLLNIPAYVKPAKEPAVTSAPSRATLPTTAITQLKTTSGGLNLLWKAVEGATKYQVFRSTKKSTGFKRVATVTDTAWQDTSVQRNNAYYYYIKAIGADGAYSKSATKGRWHDFGPTAKFTRASNGTVTISWPSKKNAVSYAVYRADEGSTSYKKIATVDELSYVDKSAVNGKTYSYFIQANYTVNGLNVMGSQGARKAYTYGVTAAENVAAATLSSGVRVTWDPVDNATGYRVFYRKGTSGTWTTLKTTAASAKYYNHTGAAYGEVIQYSVRTVGKLNGKTVYAPHSIVTHVALAKPTASLAVENGDTLFMSWTLVDGADGYEVTLTCGDEVTKYEFDASTGGMYQALETSGEYRLTVRAFCDADGVRYYGAVSNTAAVTADYTDPALIPVASVTLSDVPNLVDVTWNAITGADSYTVTVEASNGTQTANVSAAAIGSSFAVNEGAVRVQVEAHLSDGRTTRSEAVTVTADWADGLTLTAPTLTATQQDTYNRVQVEWSEVAGASQYRLVVADANDSTYENTLVDTARSTLTTVNGNSTYTFRVRAEAALSNGVILYGPWTEQQASFEWTEAQRLVPDIDVNLSSEANYIHVTWSAVSGVDSYTVCVYGENDGWMVTESTTDTEILIPVNGGETIRVTACSVYSRGQSDFCEAVYIDTQWADMIAMTAPDLMYSLNAKPNVAVEWDMVAGATDYRLFVTAAGEGAGQYDLNGTGCDLTVTPDVAYQFNVLPMCTLENGDTILGPRSAFVNCYPVWSEDTVPAMTVLCADAANVLLVTWDPLALADYYEILITDNSGSEYTWEGAGTAAAIPVNGSDSYTATMRAIMTDDTYGEWCAAQTVTPSWTDMVTLTAPVVTLTLDEKIDDATGYVKAAWPAVDGAFSYEVYGEDGMISTTQTSVFLKAQAGSTLSVEVVPVMSTTAGSVYGPAGKASIQCIWEIDVTAVPQNLKADLSVTNYVTFTWDACYGAVGYRIQTHGSVWSKEVSTNDPYTVWMTDTNQTQTAKVCAVYEVDGTTVCSAYATLTYAPIWDEPAIDLPEPVISVALSGDANYLEITWEPMEDATSYTLVASGMKGDDWGTSYHREVTGSSCKLWVNAGETYYVSLCANRDADGMSLSGPYCGSEEIEAVWTDGVEMTAPTASVSAGDANELSISWTAVTGATHYYVSVVAGTESYDAYYHATGTTLDVTVPYNDTYYVTVLPYCDELTNNGPWSNQASVTPEWDDSEVIVLPDPVVRVDASVPNVLTVNWGTVTNAEKYIVRVGLKDYASKNVFQTTESTGLSFSLPVNGDGTEYYFSVAAVATKATGETITSAFGGDKAAAAWENGVKLVANAPAIYANSCNDEMGLVEAYAFWTPTAGAEGGVLTWQAEDGSPVTGAYEDADSIGVELTKGATYTFTLQEYFTVNGTKVWGPVSNEVTYVALYGADALTAPEMTLSIDEDGYVLVTWEAVDNASGYTITYQESGGTASAQYVEAFTGENYDVPVTSWRFKPEPSSQYAVSMCATWEEDGIVDAGLSCDAQTIEAMLAEPVLTAVMSDTPNYLELSWTAVPYADDYDVRVTCGDDQRTLHVDAAVTSLTVPVNNNSTYTVQVRATADFADGHSLTSYAPDKTAHCTKSIDTSWADGVTLTAPAGLKLVAGDAFGVIDLAWDAVAGATGYRVVCTAGTWAEVLSSTGNSATVTLPRAEWWSEMTVQVCAVADDGQNAYGPYCGDYADAALTPDWQLPAEVNIAQSATPNYIDVTWDKDSAFDYYQVTIESYSPYSYRTVEVEGAAGGIALLADNNNAYNVTVSATLTVDDNTLDTLEKTVTVDTAWANGVSVLPPANVYADLSATPGEIIVRWDEVPGVTGYLVTPGSYSWGGDEEAVVVPAGTTTVTFTVPELAWFEQATVHVLSYLTDGVEEDYGYVWSDYGADVTVDMDWLVAPEVILIDAADNCLDLTWKEMVGVEVYNVYLKPNDGAVLVNDPASGESYAVSRNGTYVNGAGETVNPDELGFVQLPALTSGVELWLNAGHTVSVYVEAVYPDGTAGLTPAVMHSSEVTGTAAGTALASVGVTAEPGEEGFINVSWTAVEGADGYAVETIIGGESRTETRYAADTLGFSLEIPMEYWGQSVQVCCYAVKDMSGVSGYPASLELQGETSYAVCDAEWTVDLTAPVMTLDVSDRGWLTVSWEDIPDATKYRIFYKETSASGFSNLYVDGGETSVKLPAANDSTYRVYMRAVHVSGSGVTTSGEACTAKNVTTAWSGMLARPTLTVANGARGVLNLSWTAVSGAEGYVLYYKDAEKSAYASVVLDASTLAYELTVTAETTVDLYVCAFEGDASLPYEGRASTVQSYFATWAVDLAEPTMTLDQQAHVYYKLRVSWQPVENATRYRIFYKEESASGFSNLFVEGDQTSCRLDVENGKTYIVYMRAIHVAEDGVTTSGPICAKQTVAVYWPDYAVPTPSLTVTPVSGDETNTVLQAEWTVPDAYCGYVLYYRQAGETAFSSLDVTDLTAPAETFTVATGETLEFYMQAYFTASDTVTFYGDPTEILTVKAAYGVHALEAPEMTLSLDTENYITVALDEQTFATHFLIYYRKDGETAFTEVEIEAGENPFAQLVDAEETYVFYARAAFEENGVLQEGPACAEQTVYAYWPPAMPAPTLTVNNGYNGKVDLAWTAVEGVTSYTLGYGASDSDWTLVEDLPVETLSYSLRLTTETAYTFCVTPVHTHNGVDYEGNAAQQTVTTKGAPVLAAPVMTLALGEKGYVNISWKAVTDATGYSIFYKKSADSAFTNVKVDGTVTSYILPVELLDTYTVYMRAIHEDEEITTSGAKCANQTIATTWVKYRALLIGQTYPGTDNALPGPDVDARSMKSMLSAMSGTPYTTTVKYNQTASGILSAIKSAFAGADEDSVSLFYYSGHGAQSYGSSYHGALCGTNSTYVTISQLRAALDAIPGTKIVLLDSCHSGEHIGKSVTLDASGNTVTTVTKDQLASFNSQVIAAFSSQSRSNLAASNYYVITACRSDQNSQSVSYDGVNYVGLFTYALMFGSGYDELNGRFLSGLYSDTNGDGAISLAEGYSYAYTNALSINSDQHAQVYPTNSSFVLWSR